MAGHPQGLEGGGGDGDVQDVHAETARRSQGTNLRRVGPPSPPRRGESREFGALNPGMVEQSERAPSAAAASERKRSKEPVLLERHELFASTVKLAGERWFEVKPNSPGLPNVDRSWASSMLGSLGKEAPSRRMTPRSSRMTTPVGAPPGAAPTAWRDSRPGRTPSAGSQTAREWTDYSQQDLGASRSTTSPPRAWTGDSAQDARSVSSRAPGSSVYRGVRIHHNRLHRFDTIPCARTGRRAHHSGHSDMDIRIFFRLPGGSRFALWVPPDILIGPQSRCTSGRDIFTDFWGDDAEVRGPCAGRQPQSGRLTPVRALLAQQQQAATNVGGDAEAYSTVDRSPGSPGTFDMESGSFDLGSSARSMQSGETLKDLIEKATGIASDQMMIVPSHGCRGRLENAEWPLCNYDVGHGAMLFLTVTAPPRKQQAVVTQNYNAEKHRHITHSPNALTVKAKDVVSVVTIGKKWVLVETATGERGKVPRSVLHIEDQRYVADTKLEIGLDEKVFKHMEQFRASSWRSAADRKAKDTIMPLPDWEAFRHPPRPKEEPADEILHFDYSFLRDNNIFDVAGRIRKGFIDIDRRSQHGARDKGLKAPQLPPELQL